MRSGALATFLCCLTLPCLALPSVGTESAEATRPEIWAQPVEVEGVSNLYKISDDLYRSAQPKPEGMESLSSLGVKTIVSVRFFHSGRRPTDDTDLTFERIAIKPWHPTEKQVVRFLQIATDPEQTPVLLHCYKGADRTGMLSAMYRIVVQGWSKEAAIEEMKAGGYGFNPLWNNLVRWINRADMERLREEVGLSRQPEADQAGFGLDAHQSLELETPAALCMTSCLTR